MAKIKDLTGQKFGRLTVLSRTGGNPKTSFWMCRCDCGAEKSVRGNNLKSGATTSCGCYAIELLVAKQIDLSGKRFGHLVPIKRTKRGGGKRKNQYWECLCDCGKKIEVAASNLFAGNQITCGCRKGFRPNWKGGRTINSQGYVQLRKPEHPLSVRGYILEHRLIMEGKIGRQLLATETVHHKNGVKHDNRIENLELWVTPQRAGQRPEDLVRFAREILETYGDLFPN